MKLCKIDAEYYNSTEEYNPKINITKNKIQFKNTIMKISKFLPIAIIFIASNSTQAQTETTTTTATTKMTLPDWGVAGQDNATYYYLPATETYYDIRKGEYVYLQDGQWTRTTTMPTTYKDYNLYDGYKVVLTDENEPFADYENMKVKYAKDFKGDPQKTYKVKKTRTGKVKIKEK